MSKCSAYLLAFALQTLVAVDGVYRGLRLAPIAEDPFAWAATGIGSGLMVALSLFILRRIADVREPLSAAAESWHRRSRDLGTAPSAGLGERQLSCEPGEPAKR